MKRRNLLGERKDTTTGLIILVARLTARQQENFSALPLLCQSIISALIRIHSPVNKTITLIKDKMSSGPKPSAPNRSIQRCCNRVLFLYCVTSYPIFAPHLGWSDAASTNSGTSSAEIELVETALSDRFDIL